MGLGTNPKYIAKKLTDVIDSGGWVRYEVEELIPGNPSRKFTAELTHTETTRDNAQHLIERWCELYPEKLPFDGGTFWPDLAEVKRSTDRRVQ